MEKRLPIAAWLLVSVLYVATMAHVLGPADSPEFVALMQLGGFAHPPGSPTTVAIYHAFSWLPLAAPVAASLVTVMLGSLAVAALYQACRAWGVDRRSSTVAMVLVGLHAQIWLIHTHPEAFAVNNLFAALILWLAAPNSPVRGTARVAVLGTLAGLGLGAHQSLVLMAPVGLFGVWLGGREAKNWFLALGCGAATLALGISVYGTMLLWDSPVSFGVIDDWSSLMDHVLRRAYGTLSLSAHGTAGPVEQLGFWLYESLGDSAVVGLLLALIGGVASVRQDRRFAAVVLTALLAGPLFIGILNIDPAGPRAEMVKRFHALGFVAAAPLIASGARFVMDHPLSRNIKIGAAVGALVLLLGTGMVRTSAVYSGTLEGVLRNTLDTLPPDAVIVATGDHRYFGWQYLQKVEGVRPDVQVVGADVLGFDWHVDRLRSETGLEVPYAAERIPLADVFALLRTTGRPVYTTNDFAPEIHADLVLAPDGPAWRLEETAPPADEVFARTKAKFGAFDADTPTPVYIRDPWGWSLFITLRKVWEDIEARCKEAGADCAAEAAAEVRRYPDL